MDGTMDEVVLPPIVISVNAKRRIYSGVTLAKPGRLLSGRLSDKSSFTTAGRVHFWRTPAQTYMRAFGDRLRNFEPWPSDGEMTPGLAPPLLTTTPHQTEERFSSR
ncbi:hypothetical protein TNCV_3191201 [Trichonephila clavipes]|nr:hypothetical protein TNCV_3191201 [Trichonephila clavipes]